MVPQVRDSHFHAKEAIAKSSNLNAKDYLSGDDDSVNNQPNLANSEGNRHDCSESTGSLPKRMRMAPDFEMDDCTPDGLNGGITHDQAIPVTNLQDFHCILHAVLASYKLLDDHEGIEFDLFYKGKTHHLSLVLFVAYVKGDTVEHEKHCGKYGCRTGKVSCLCRYCCCPTDETDDPFKCYPLKVSQ